MSVTRALVTTFDENYLWPGIVAGATALENSPADVALKILGVNLSREAIETITSAIPTDRLEVLDAASLAEGMPEWQHISNAAWARIGMGSLLPDSVERVVYVDADTLTRGDLTPLFELNLGGCVIGACIDRPMPTHWARHLLAKAEEPHFDYASDTSAPIANTYFNSGVMTIDLVKWKQADVESRVLDIGQALPPSFSLLDQDALNSALFDEWFLMDWRQWNWPGYLKDELAWDANIVHFVSSPKPWVSSPLGAPFNLEYRKTARNLGWKLNPGRIRVRSGLIETIIPYSLVVRRKRISRFVRGSVSRQQT